MPTTGPPSGPSGRSTRRWTSSRASVRQLGGKMAEHRLLRRDVDTNRELYTVLLTRLKETQIASALVTSNISIVDRAEVPLTPIQAQEGGSTSSSAA